MQRALVASRIKRVICCQQRHAQSCRCFTIFGKLPLILAAIMRRYPQPDMAFLKLCQTAQSPLFQSLRRGGNELQMRRCRLWLGPLLELINRRGSYAPLPHRQSNRALRSSSRSPRCSSKSSNFNMQLPLVARILPVVSIRVRLPHPLPRCRISDDVRCTIGKNQPGTGQKPQIRFRRPHASASLNFSGSPASRLAFNNPLFAHRRAHRVALSKPAPRPKLLFRSAIPMAFNPNLMPSAT